MKVFLPFFISLTLFSACTTKESLSLNGTWLLLSGTTIEKGDTTFADYTKNQKVIKIINDTHFSFLRHDLAKGKDSTFVIFVAGGGTYSLQDSIYKENLEYCNFREWENNSFEFTMTLHNDTLTQKGIEKIDSLGINRLTIEKYVKFKE